MSEVEFSLVLPAYNEVDDLPRAVVSYLMELENVFGKDGFELIIVEDGCVDGTTSLSQFLSNKFDNVRHLHFDERQGRGLAVSKAFDIAKGTYYAYSDIDFSTNAENINRLVENLGVNGKLVVGSRVNSQSSFNRFSTRAFLSSYYNKFARFLLGSDVSDHQCGLKVIHSDVFESLKADIESEHWSWDTELLYKAQQTGINITEIPISGEESRDSTVKFLDPFLMGFNLLSMKYK